MDVPLTFDFVLRYCKMKKSEETAVSLQDIMTLITRMRKLGRT